MVRDWRPGQRERSRQIAPARALTELPLKLVLLEGQPDQPTVMDHLGVEVEITEQVTTAAGRLAGEGLDTAVEDDTTCC